MHHISEMVGTIEAFIFTVGAFKPDSGPGSAAGLKVLQFLLPDQRLLLPSVSLKAPIRTGRLTRPDLFSCATATVKFGCFILYASVCRVIFYGPYRSLVVSPQLSVGSQLKLLSYRLIVSISLRVSASSGSLVCTSAATRTSSAENAPDAAAVPLRRHLVPFQVSVDSVTPENKSLTFSPQSR